MPRRLAVLCTLMWVICALRASGVSANPHVVGKQIAYTGVHPVPAEEGGAFCNIEGPHVHLYRPDHADVLYRVVGGAYLFVGDPAPFGYDGPKHAYHGRHPIPVDELVGGDHREHDGELFCYLDGPHYHIYLPPPALKFVLRGDAYWYVGDWPRSYRLDAPRYQKINAAYAPLQYARPVVTVSAPVGYHVPIVEVDVPRPVPIVVRHPAPVIEVRVPWIVVEDGTAYDGYAYDIHYHRRPHHHHHHHDDDD